MTGRNWAQTLIQAAVVVVAMVAGGVLAVNFADGDSAPAATGATLEPGATQSVSLTATEAPAATADAAVSAAALVPLADVVDDVKRSVVSIHVVEQGTTQTRFGAREFRPESEGSGIVLDSEGHILTNYHVIEGADEIAVTLWDGTAVRAQLLGVDPANDLAVLKASFQPQRLIPARIGDSEAVRPGEPVFAIGSPFSFDFSVTQGIVSGIGRETSASSTGRAIRGVIQTDAAVNPGNSGGPLFNAAGEVIGINSAIHNNNQEPDGSPSRVFVGIGLAIPINTAIRFLPQLIASEEIVHTQLGIAGVTISALNAADAKVGIERGVYVTGVGADSAADRAGLIPSDRNDGGFLFAGGDVITAINGVEVTSIEELARIVDGHDVGDEVTLSVYRDGQTIELVATLLEWNG
ncbi:MAG TPA: trypsin-like peptidase domain-containing protein [Dehalococcoidia bacterium]|jgi:putative serine protease PepD|nr:trypsin-like peptidase domain-containing protein [Dehalococcoidia bacterium]